MKGPNDKFTKDCFPPAVATESKNIFPPGGHHNGSLQTTEEDASRNRKRMVYGHFPPFDEKKYKEENP